MPTPTIHYTRWYTGVAVCGEKLVGRAVYASVHRAAVTCAACLAARLPPSGCLNCAAKEPT